MFKHFHIICVISSEIPSIEMFLCDVQALPDRNEVIGELQPYIENVLRADDPKFWEKLRYVIILSIVRGFLRNDLELKLTSQRSAEKYSSRLDLPQKEPDKVESRAASSSQGGRSPLYPTLEEEMLEQL